MLLLHCVFIKLNFFYYSLFNANNQVTSASGHMQLQVTCSIELCSFFFFFFFKEQVSFYIQVAPTIFFFLQSFFVLSRWQAVEKHPHMFLNPSQCSNTLLCLQSKLKCPPMACTHFSVKFCNYLFSSLFHIKGRACYWILTAISQGK